MVKSGGLLALALLALPADGGADEPVERESEYEMPAGEAWALPGFRVQLRFGRDLLTGADDSTPDASGFSFAVEPGIRLSSALSVAATLRYAALVDGFRGVRYSTSGEVAWHPWGGLFLAGGVGYAGLVGGVDYGQSCDGDGVLLLARTGWLMAAGEIFATGPVLQMDEQWTWCGRQSSFDEADVFRHRTLHLSWSLAWR